jgi:hypothetical protein
MAELGTAHGRVKLDKDVAGPDALTVAHMDGTHLMFNGLALSQGDGAEL